MGPYFPEDVLVGGVGGGGTRQSIWIQFQNGLIRSNFWTGSIWNWFCVNSLNDDITILLFNHNMLGEDCIVCLCLCRFHLRETGSKLYIHCIARMAAYVIQETLVRTYNCHHILVGTLGTRS